MSTLWLATGSVLLGLPSINQNLHIVKMILSIKRICSYIMSSFLNTFRSAQRFVHSQCHSNRSQLFGLFPIIHPFIVRFFMSSPFFNFSWLGFHFAWLCQLICDIHETLFALNLRVRCPTSCAFIYETGTAFLPLPTLSRSTVFRSTSSWACQFPEFFVPVLY